MARKKKRRKRGQKRATHRAAVHEPAPRRPAAPPAPLRDTDRWTRRPALVFAASLIVAAAVALAVFGSRYTSRAGSAFPPPPVDPAATTQVTFDEFAGAESCEECHETEYEAWRGSTHGKAGGPASPQMVIAPFDGTPIRFADAVVIPSVNSEGRYQFSVTVEGQQAQVLTVAGVIGGGHMEGGGTQGFVSEYPDGTTRFLPFDFIKREGVWFCNTNSRTDRGWIPITRDMLLAECADWPAVRLLGTNEYYANCQECHVAQIALAFDSTASRYSTRITTFAIDCEACHGPMAEHVKRSHPDRIEREDDIAVQALATLSKDQSLQVCFRCHALKDVMQQGYVPGEPFEQYYSLGYPMLTGGPLYPDGRIRTFAYQANHRYSDCYLNGSMTCVDCHDPHSQSYRDIWGRELAGRFSDGQCTDCHPSKAERPEEHTHHDPGTDGSRCVDCHMPYLQHPELGSALRFARSDHTIPIPRPGMDDRMGIVNACALSECHPDSSVAALEAITREWYGELKPHKPIIAALLSLDELEEERAAAAVLLDAGATHPAAQIEAIGAFATRFLSPDMYQLETEAEQSLRNLSQSSDLDLRAAALAALHFARGRDRDTREFLIRALKESGDRERALRVRWAAAVGTFADTYLGTGDWSRAIITYRKALEISPDNPAILMNLGLAQVYAQDFRGAATSLQQSLAADSRRPLAWVNLGLAMEGLGNTAEAEAAYRRALEVKEEEALAHFNLGNMLLRRGDQAGALERYQRAVELQPTLTQAYLNIVRLQVDADDVAAAVQVARRWARFAPEDPRPRQLIAEVERARRRN